MSHDPRATRTVKRCLGESKLERRLRISFGVCFVLITAVSTVTLDSLLSDHVSMAARGEVRGKLICLGVMNCFFISVAMYGILRCLVIRPLNRIVNIARQADVAPGELADELAHFCR